MTFDTILQTLHPHLWLFTLVSTAKKIPLRCSCTCLQSQLWISLPEVQNRSLWMCLFLESRGSLGAFMLFCFVYVVLMSSLGWFRLISVLLPQSFQCWDDRQEPPQPAPAIALTADAFQSKSLDWALGNRFGSGSLLPTAMDISWDWSTDA